MRSSSHALRRKVSCALLAGAASVAGLVPSWGASGTIEFNRDIRPILSDTCIACHGPDEHERKADLRLDVESDALRDLGGYAAIVPGHPEASVLLERVRAEDPDERMPPPETKKKLSEEEIDLLERWIASGAKYEDHWAFIAPVKRSLPAVDQTDWPASAIDHFVLARLEEEGLVPSPRADKETLIRRVTFDLTGLPPTPEEVASYLQDDSADAYEKVVERLLESRHYGEHMARFWLDAARYGDTHGLHLDNYREIWPYRDWVIDAFNANKPFDTFITEQLAGDLVENPTQDQRIATGFNRAHVTTSEGGSIAEEVYVRNVTDRVETTGTVMMGLTVGCAVCHDHKYDPISQKEFYQLFAFFNSLDANPLDGNAKDHAPVIRVTSPQDERQLKTLAERRAAVAREIEEKVASYAYADPGVEKRNSDAGEPFDRAWIDDELPSGAQPSEAWPFVTKDDHPVYSGSRSHRRSAEGLSQHYFTGGSPPLEVHSAEDRLFAYVYLDPENPPKEIMLQFNDGSWDHRAYWGENVIDWGQDGTASRRHLGDLPEPGQWARLEIDPQAVGLEAGSRINGWAFTQFDGTVYWDNAGLRSRHGQQPAYRSLAAWLRDQEALEEPTVAPELKALVKKPAAERSEAEKASLRGYFIEHVLADTREQFAPLHEKLKALDAEEKAIEEKLPTTLVWKEKKTPREAYVLIRGEYDKRGPQVERATPAFLPPFPDEANRDRLGLAKWLVDSEHPLTARVAVNRFWQQVFGVGIVKTAEDFGSQGEWPSHPQLLDWLAVDFQEHGWNVKRLMRQIVLSSTYRQASHMTPESHARDPQNRLLARGPRFRLDAEMLRDQALSVSGLLVDQVGGPSVRPPQPDGLWFAVGYSGSNTVRFKQDEGADKVHRRTLYTFLKRTAPPPQMKTFDAPSRESCTVRRERTNTPLQALLLMNDPQYFEAARALGERILKEGEGDVSARLRQAFFWVTARQPDAEELAELTGVYDDYRQVYAADHEAAKKLIDVGESKADPSLDPVALATWAMVANLMLNLDEVITKT